VAASTLIYIKAVIYKVRHWFANKSSRESTSVCKIMLLSLY